MHYHNRIVHTFFIGFSALLFCVHGFAADLNLQTAVRDHQPNFIHVAKQAIPAVVSIQVKGIQKNQESPFGHFNDDLWHKFFGIPSQNINPQEYLIGQASGFIVSADGYIITSVHVVKDANEITVFLNDDRKFSGKVIGLDTNTDIALIKIDANHLPYLKLGDSDTLEVGQWVAAIGTPMGLQASLTQGIVSAKSRNNLDLTRVEDFIQTDAPLNRGNSGGPLLNLEAEVIGINTAKGVEGIGFAVPSNIAKNVMEQLISKGSVSRGFIGVILQEIDQDLAAALGLKQPDGVLVAQVSKNSPAEKAGIKQGDIIIKYNHYPANSIGALRTAIALMQPGTKIQLTVLRDGQLQTIELEIGDFSTISFN